MERCSIHAYEPRHFGQVSGLMAESRRVRRRQFPMLPASLEDSSTSSRLLEGSGSGSGEGMGVVALTGDGSLAGFLFAQRREDPVWGPSVVAEVNDWALSPGVLSSGVGVQGSPGALSPGLSLSPSLDTSTLARMYAAAFEPRTRGACKHIVRCPAFDTMALQSWFHLGFGMEQAYAAARLAEMDSDYPAAPGLEIRRAGPGDADILVEFSPLIVTMQAGAPVWAGAPDSYLAGLREGFRALSLDEKEKAIVLVAFRGNKAVGYQAWFPAETDPVEGPTEGAVELSVGATVPEERGTGVGRALTARGVSEAQKLGYSICLTDWRTTNPLALCFWPARGFKAYEYRLVRRIDPIAL